MICCNTFQVSIPGLSFMRKHGILLIHQRLRPRVASCVVEVALWVGVKGVEQVRVILQSHITHSDCFSLFWLSSNNLITHQMTVPKCFIPIYSFHCRSQLAEHRADSHRFNITHAASQPTSRTVDMSENRKRLTTHLVQTSYRLVSVPTSHKHI